jgi:hypothetical protein
MIERYRIGEEERERSTAHTSYIYHIQYHIPTHYTPRYPPTSTNRHDPYASPTLTMQRYQTLINSKQEREIEEGERQVYRLGMPPMPILPVMRPPPAFSDCRTIASAACAAARRSCVNISIKVS